MTRGWASLAVVAGLVLALQIACRSGLLAHTVIIPPTEMAASLWSILRSGRFAPAIALTLGNVAIASVISIVAGFALGVGIHASRFLRRGVEPYLASYYAVPTFILYPVFIVLLGVGSAAIIAIAVVLAVVAMITATLAGIDGIPPVFGRTARALRLSPWQMALCVQLPAAGPALFTGARLAVAYAFIGVIASEFVLSGNGLGYEIAFAYNDFDNPTMYGLMLLVVLAVSAVNLALEWLDRRLTAHLR